MQHGRHHHYYSQKIEVTSYDTAREHCRRIAISAALSAGAASIASIAAAVFILCLPRALVAAQQVVDMLEASHHCITV